MAHRMSATRLRAELFKTLNQVVSSGESVQIERPGGTVRIVLAASGSRLARLSSHPGTVSGNPEDWANLSWEDAWQPVR